MKKTLNKYIKDVRKMLILYIIEGVIFSIVSVAAALSFQWIIDYAVLGEIGKLSITVAICIGVYAISYGFYLLDSFLFQKIIKHITSKLKKDVYINITKLSMEEYGSNSSSYYLNIFQNDVPSLVSSYYENILSLISQIIGLVLSMAFTFAINWIIGLIVTFIAILAAFIPRLFESKLEKMVENNLKKSERYLNKLQNLLGAFELTKIYNLFDKTTSMHDDEVESFCEDTFRLKIQSTKIGLVSSIFTILAYISVFVIGAYLVAYGYGIITIGAIVALSQLIGSVMSPIEQIPLTITSIRTSFPARKRVYEVLKEENEKQIDLNEERINSITFEDVSFCYKDSDEYSLTKFSFNFLKGKRYLIIGESGSGKSTVNKLILGLIKPSSGEIYVNDKKINNNINVIYKNMSYMNQDPFVFENSLKENITLFGDYNESRFAEAIKFAKIDSFVQNLSKKENTNIGENGSKLSGGEKQRVCIARTKYHASDVVVLDEFTSNLDIEVTYSIFNDLTEDSNTCYVVVMHNITRKIVKLFDEVIVLKKGEILESGNSIELLNKQESYLSSLLKIIED